MIDELQPDETSKWMNEDDRNVEQNEHIQRLT